MKLNTHFIGDITVLALTGRYDAHAAPTVTEWLQQNTSAVPARVVVNVGGVNFMDPTALATLVQGMKHARQTGGDLHLCNLRRPVRIIFELTRLDQAFGIYPTEIEAVKAFGG